MPELRLVPRRLLTISPEETKFARRGFRAFDAAVQKRLEEAGASFLLGYHAALEPVAPDELAARLGEIPAEFRGFAFEGAGMSLFLGDRLTLFRRKSRFDCFLAGPGSSHAYMMHVGAGWAMARLPRSRGRVARALERMHPLLRWLALDGFGFHEGYFHAGERVRARRVPADLGGYQPRAFDQGLGRSLWFVDGADPGRIPATIMEFEENRRGDLWSGVGLACGYAGGLEESGIARLVDAAGAYVTEFAQGVAFAAKARESAGNPSVYTERACRIVWGASAAAAATMTDKALAGLRHDASEPAYEHWRRRIQIEMKHRMIPQGVLK